MAFLVVSPPFNASLSSQAFLGSFEALLFAKFVHFAFVEPLTEQEIRQAVQLALAEDVGSGDATTVATVPEDVLAKALMRSREPLVVAGLEFAEAAFKELSPGVQILMKARDGEHVSTGNSVMELSGQARALLTAERVALNFVQRLSGIATLTNQFVQALSGTRAQVLDTRKTTPGWRRFEKYAVCCGGGKNHRLGLFDMVLIKDNHLAALSHEGPNAIGTAVKRAQARYPELKIEVEVDTLEQVEQALAAGAHLILLDNMNPVQLRLAGHVDRQRVRNEDHQSSFTVFSRVPSPSMVTRTTSPPRR